MDDRPANEPTDPEVAADSTGFPPSSPAGWVLPADTVTEGGAAGRSKPTNPVALGLAWIVAVAALAFRNLGSLTGSAGATAYETGQAVGSILAPVLLALFLRWVYVRFRGGSVLRSGWVPLLVIALTALSLYGAIAARIPADPEAAMRVSPPYTLAEADAATVEQIIAGLREDDPLARAAVRLVNGPDGSSSLLFASDGNLVAGDIAEVARGVSSGSGLEASVQDISGTDVAVAIGEQSALGSWIDAPLLMSVVAADEATLRAVIDAVINAP